MPEMVAGVARWKVAPHLPRRIRVIAKLRQGDVLRSRLPGGNSCGGGSGVGPLLASLCGKQIRAKSHPAGTHSRDFVRKDSATHGRREFKVRLKIRVLPKKIGLTFGDLGGESDWHLELAPPEIAADERVGAKIRICSTDRRQLLALLPSGKRFQSRILRRCSFLGAFCEKFGGRIKRRFVLSHGRELLAIIAAKKMDLTPRMDSWKSRGRSEIEETECARQKTR